jgi:transposase InsO family protein
LPPARQLLKLKHRNGLGLKLCFTPVRSPVSNGIAEAFVKTFKRDYAWLSILPDAETAIAVLPIPFSACAAVAEDPDGRHDPSM